MRTVGVSFAAIFLLSFYSLSTPESQRDDCTASGCHSTMLDFESLHPAAEDDCESCHESGSGNHPGDSGAEFSLSAEVPDLCSDCHDEKNNLDNVHEPVADGYCLDCHSPHGSSQPFMLMAEEGESICSTCHDVTDESDAVVHGPVASNLCTSCHNPHQSENRTLLRETPPALCIGCHEDIGTQLSLEVVHDAFEDDCTNCHSPHGTPNEFLLLDQVPTLCFDCHDDVEEDISEKANVHQPMEETASCMACHSPHASEQPAMLVDEPLELCLNCHSLKASSNVRAVRDKVLDGMTEHPPAADGDCVDCHAPHASNQSSLLASAFPDGNYAIGEEETYELCFQCHDSDLLEVERSTSATDFRNGDKNLHFVHLKLQKGRSCITCHDVHGSDGAHLITESVVFGSWEMPIVYEASETGGTCLPGCHSSRMYVNVDGQTGDEND